MGLDAVHDGDARRDADALRPFAALVSLALSSEDCVGFVAAAEATLGHPLGVVGPYGESVAHAPAGEAGEGAVEVARRARRNGGRPPAGWRILPLPRSSGTLAAAVGPGSDAGGPLLELVAALLGDQLRRATLRRSQLRGFLRRLAAAGTLSAEDVRREAAELDVALADAYHPAVVAWRGDTHGTRILAVLERASTGLSPPALAVPLPDVVALLYPGDSRAPAAMAWFRAVVAETRRVAPASTAQVIVADQPVELVGIGAAIAELQQLLAVSRRSDDDRPVLTRREYAVERLLWDALGTERSRAFVNEQLGQLLAWDAGHRNGLAVVLEAALDYPRRDEAATRCFMHRNTFRHRLGQAVEALNVNLDEPRTRLAVHLALKLRRLLPPQP